MNARHDDLWLLDSKNFPASGLRDDQLRFLLGYAALAPSGHNTQPWLFRVGDEKVEVVADRTRALPVVDPFDRELCISCGAAIGNFEIAARQFGFNTDVETSLVSDNPDLLASIILKDGDPPSSAETAIFEAITQRRTDRAAFSMYPMPGALIKQIRHAAELLDVGFVIIEDEPSRTEVAKLVAEGDRLQFKDPSFRRELGSWVHSSRSGSRDGMSGASFGMLDLLSPMGQFVIRTFDIGKGVAAGDKEKILSGSPALLVLASETDDQDAWLSTGRALARILLLLSAEGFASSYLNQPIEVESLRPQLGEVAGIEAFPQILLRAGKSNRTLQPTVRRELSEVIIN